MITYSNITDTASILLVLERYGSTQDPIIYKGEETTPEDLLCTMHSFSGRITYWAFRSGKMKKIRGGSFGGMINDRIEMHTWEPRLPSISTAELETGEWLAWVPKVCDGERCDSREEALESLCSKLAAMLRVR